MGSVWQIFLMLVTLFEIIFATENFAIDYPFSKSLGYFDQKNYLDKILSDFQFSQEHREPYRETLSRESLEIIDDMETKQLEKVIGTNNAKLMRQGLDRRRSTFQFRSLAGRRHTRSQTLRREKLNVQSSRSHLSHTKHSNADK